jgi:exodeoxyribonuclease V alpha subunit
MQIKNDYDLAWTAAGGGGGMGVFNGEVGVIRDIRQKEELVTVVFDDKSVVYGPDKLSELEPAFAMTVHKAQGSEYPAVVLALADSPKPLLSRRVLYTAMTRARNWLILVGDERLIAEMVRNARRGTRYSGLRAFIENR